MTEPQIRFDDGAAYERMMGVWSQLAGEQFLDWLAPAGAEREESHRETQRRVVVAQRERTCSARERKTFVMQKNHSSSRSLLAREIFSG